MFVFSTCGKNYNLLQCALVCKQQQNLILLNKSSQYSLKFIGSTPYGIFLLSIHLLIKEPDGASLIRQHTTSIYICMMTLALYTSFTLSGHKKGSTDTMHSISSPKIMKFKAQAISNSHKKDTDKSFKEMGTSSRLLGYIYFRTRHGPDIY